MDTTKEFTDAIAEMDFSEDEPSGTCDSDVGEEPSKGFIKGDSFKSQLQPTTDFQPYADKLSNGNEKELEPSLLDAALKEAGLDFATSPSKPSNSISYSVVASKSQAQPSPPQGPRIVRMTNGQLRTALANSPRATLVPSRTLPRAPTAILPIQPSGDVCMTGSSFPTPTRPVGVPANVRIVTVTRSSLNATLSKTSSPTPVPNALSSASSPNIITINSHKLRTTAPTTAPTTASAEPPKPQPAAASSSESMSSTTLDTSSISTLTTARPLTGAKAKVLSKFVEAAIVTRPSQSDSRPPPELERAESELESPSVSKPLSLDEAPMLSFRQTPIADLPPDLQPRSSAARPTLVRTEVQESPIAQLRPASAQSGAAARSDNLLDIPASGVHNTAGAGVPQRPTPLMPGAPQTDPTIEAVTDELDEAGLTETYAEYNPKKLKYGRPHPDPVVETNSLASVEPPDIVYRPRLPEYIIAEGHLSALQLESVVYAGQRHGITLKSGERAGFFIGDGPGVGKGRTIAGIILDCFLHEHKRALWLSVSSDLKEDAERDLYDLGPATENIKVHLLQKFKYKKIQSSANGKIREGVIFSTYSSLISETSKQCKYKSRMKQLVKWCGPNFEGAIVFDECHRAKNLVPSAASKPTKIGQAVLELQKQLPKARIVYASATGASEPRNMGYMVRLGLWGPGTGFENFEEFIQMVDKRGVGAMEMVAMEMKQRGMYVARQLSFKDVQFKVERVPLALSYLSTYNSAVDFWNLVHEHLTKALEMINSHRVCGDGQQMSRLCLNQFWSAHQRFFKYLCISAKVAHAVDVAKEALRSGKCVVIGLQSTGEARLVDALEDGSSEDASEFVSTAKGVVQNFLKKHFPSAELDESSSGGRRQDPAPNEDELLNKLLATGDNVDDALNLLFDSPKTAPVAQLKGRRKRGGKSQKASKKPKAKKAKKDKDADGDDRNSSSSSSEEEEADSEDDKELESEADRLVEELRTTKSGRSPGSSSRSSMASGPQRFSFGGGMDADVLYGVLHQMRVDLLEKLELLGKDLPPNPLDFLVDALGGPASVAEMTGRRIRQVQVDDKVTIEKRAEADVPIDVINLKEKERFLNDEKNIAIISDAASSGISLQADRRVANQRTRVHLTLELPWSADKAVQQFGRTHRSNQVRAPEYVLLISELAGEQRFASAVARRLESLGALTHGDRRAANESSNDLSQFNIDTKYGRLALEVTLKSLIGLDRPLVPIDNAKYLPASYDEEERPADSQRDFFREVRPHLATVDLLASDAVPGAPSPRFSLAKDSGSLNKFLNRLLGLKVIYQNGVFNYFQDTLNAILIQARIEGKLEMGLLDIGASNEMVRIQKKETYVVTSASAAEFSPSKPKEKESSSESAQAGDLQAAFLYTVQLERGLEFERAKLLLQDSLEAWGGSAANVSLNGFYVLKNAHGAQRRSPMLVTRAALTERQRLSNAALFFVDTPNFGRKAKLMNIDELTRKYRKIPENEMQPFWKELYRKSGEMCTHQVFAGHCKRQTLLTNQVRSMAGSFPPAAENDPMSTRFCDLGMRVRTLYVLSGSILTYWRFLDRTLALSAGSNYAAVGAWGQAAAAAANSQQHNVKLQLVRLRITPDSALPPERRAAVAGVVGSTPPLVDELNKRDYIVGCVIPPQCVSILRRQLDGSANTRPVLFLGGMTNNSASSSQQSLLPQTMPRPIFGQSAGAMYRAPNVPPTASATQIVTLMPANSAPSLGSPLAGVLRPPLSSPQSFASLTGPIMRVMPSTGAAFGGGAVGPRSFPNGGLPMLISGPSLLKSPARLPAPIGYSAQSRPVINLADDDDDDVIIVDPK